MVDFGLALASVMWKKRVQFWIGLGVRREKKLQVEKISNMSCVIRIATNIIPFVCRLGGCSVLLKIYSLFIFILYIFNILINFKHFFY